MTHNEKLIELRNTFGKQNQKTGKIKVETVTSRIARGIRDGKIEFKDMLNPTTLREWFEKNNGQKNK